MTTKPKILITCDYYLPGFRAGGPIVSVENLCHALKADFDFYILTRPHDFKETTPYDVPQDAWVSRPEAQVCYQKRRTFGAIVQEVQPDLIYHNSFFSPSYTLWPLLRRWLRHAWQPPVLVAPRGELKPSALQHKAWKKKLTLACAKHLGLLKGVHFHATNPEEVRYIRTIFPEMPVHEVWEPSKRQPVPPPVRKIGRLNVLFFSRIAPVKNLQGVIQAVRQCKQPLNLTIAGPKEDPAYWAVCKAEIDKLPAHIHVQVRDAVPRHEITDLFHAHDVFFFPTQGENHGHVIIEALAHGCVPIISDQTPWSDLQSHEAGFVLNVNNTAGFAQLLDQLVHRSLAAWASWQANGFTYLQHHPKLQEAVQAQRTMFNSVISEATT